MYAAKYNQEQILLEKILEPRGLEEAAVGLHHSDWIKITALTHIFGCSFTRQMFIESAVQERDFERLLHERVLLRI